MTTLTVTFTLDMMLWCMFAGICLAAAYAFYIKKTLGGFVHALIEAGAVNVYTAKTPQELGFGKSKAVMRALSKPTSLRKSLEESTQAPGSFYINPDNAEQVGRRFYDKNITVWQIILTVGIFLLITLICTWLIPLIGEFFTSQEWFASLT